MSTQTPKDQIRRKMVAAISEFDLLSEGDKLMVCLSGGKDSTVLLLLLEEIRQKAPYRFEIFPVMLDQKQPGFNADAYSAWLKQHGFELTIIDEDTYGIVKDKVKLGKSYCGLCSRLRRGILYNYAHAHGYNKLALGHHRDDLNETVLLNLFYGGRLASMPPKLFSDDGRNIVIRPLCFVPEALIETYADELAIPIIPCNLCGSQDNLKRAKLKRLLKDLAAADEGIPQSMIRAQQNIRPSQLLDKAFYATQSRPD